MDLTMEIQVVIIQQQEVRVIICYFQILEQICMNKDKI